MESVNKPSDCYFYYYSTCTKGENCIYRHEPLALGCETMCAAWQQGKCMDRRCKLRHMELKKNRKQIPCYWENQPGGCRKKYCAFLHKHPDARIEGINSVQTVAITSTQVPSSIPDSTNVDQTVLNSVVPAPVPSGPVQLLWQQQRQPVVLDTAILGVLPGSNDLMPRRMVHAHAHAHPHAHAMPHAHAHAHSLGHPHDQQPSAYAPLPVDPLVVNFEEGNVEPTPPAPTPTPTDVTEVSQELALLQQVQNATADYYGYSVVEDNSGGVHRSHRQYVTLKYKRNPFPYTSKCLRVLSAHERYLRQTNASRTSESSAHTSGRGEVRKLVRKHTVVYKEVSVTGPESTVTADKPQSDLPPAEVSVVPKAAGLGHISDDDGLGSEVSNSPAVSIAGDSDLITLDLSDDDYTMLKST